MSKTHRKSYKGNAYYKWCYECPKKQNIVIYEDFYDDDIQTKYQKQLADWNCDKPIKHHNWKKIFIIVEMFLNKKFDDLEDHLKKVHLYDEAKNYINFKSRIFKSNEFYVNSHGFICNKQKQYIGADFRVKSDKKLYETYKFNVNKKEHNIQVAPYIKYMYDDIIYFDVTYQYGYNDFYNAGEITSLKAYCKDWYRIYTFPDINKLIDNKYNKYKNKELKANKVDKLFEKFIELDFQQFKLYCQNNIKKFQKIEITGNSPFDYWNK